MENDSGCVNVEDHGLYQNQIWFSCEQLIFYFVAWVIAL